MPRCCSVHQADRASMRLFVRTSGRPSPGADPPAPSPHPTARALCLSIDHKNAPVSNVRPAVARAPDRGWNQGSCPGRVGAGTRMRGPGGGGLGARALGIGTVMYGNVAGRYFWLYVNPMTSPIDASFVFAGRPLCPLNLTAPLPGRTGRPAGPNGRTAQLLPSALPVDLFVPVRRIFNHRELGHYIDPYNDDDAA